VVAPFDVVAGSEANPRYFTRRDGLRFMDRWPDTYDDPGVEPFVVATAADDADTTADAWKQARVERDVFETGKKLCFSEQHMSDWRALFLFHTSYPTADSVPRTPVSCAATVCAAAPSPPLIAAATELPRCTHHRAASHAATDRL